MNVLCTLPMDPAGLALLPPEMAVTVLPDAHPDTLRRLLPQADFLVVRSQLPAEVFDWPQRLRAVVRHGAGLDLIPVESATAHGIPVANVPGANAQAVVEYCLASLLALARNVQAMDRTLRAEGWAQARTMSAPAFELLGKTVGIVGLGAVGGRVAHACRHGLGMRVLGHQQHYEGVADYVERCGLDELLSQSDFVVLCCPLTPQTRRMIDAGRLARMPPHAVLVNAARGAVVDEQALAAALRERRLRAAALDVYEVQPLAADHPYLGLDNVLLTPHIAGLTRESTAAMSVGTARQILQLVRGERPDHLVNPEVWDGWCARRQERQP